MTLPHCLVILPTSDLSAQISARGRHFPQPTPATVPFAPSHDGSEDEADSSDVDENSGGRSEADAEKREIQTEQSSEGEDEDESEEPELQLIEYLLAPEVRVIRDMPRRARR